MSARWDWPGARWWRVDLHAHTPASYDFRPEAARTARDWPAWLAAARDAGLDAVAVTDHNTAAAIDPIRAAAAGVPGAPVVLPGVEVTASCGTHLLFIFGPEDTSAHVDELLSRACIPVAQRGTSEARSKLNVEGLLALAVECKILCVGAHVNGPKGLFEHQGQTHIGELKHEGLLAVEVDPNHPLPTAYTHGVRDDNGRVLPQVWDSDAHALADLGARLTWVKLTRPTREGLRLALLDGQLSLRPATRATPGDPNEHAGCVIEALSVRKAKYVGRRDTLTVRFNPWLNAIIGGRGTGKSTLVDFCRLVLRRGGELRAEGGDTSLRGAFDKRMRVPPSRGDEGLLTPDTVVELIYRKDGQRFLLSWDQQGATPAIARLEGLHGDVPAVEPGDVRDRFPARIYSQKQLFDLAREPNALFTVIDDSEAVRGADLAAARQRAEAQYLSLRAEARALRAQAAQLPGRQAALADVRRKLDVLQQGGHAATLNAYRLRRRQDGTWASVRAAAVAGVDEMDAVVDALVVADLDLDGDAADPAIAALVRAHAELRAAVDALRDAARAGIEEARASIAAVNDGRDLAAWRATVAASEADYQRVTQELAAAGIANPEQYGTLLQQAAALEQEIAVLESRATAAAARDRAAEAALREYRTLRGELTQRRAAFGERTSSDLVRAEVRPAADRERLEAFVRETLGVTGFDGDCVQLRERVDPKPSAAWSYAALDTAVERLRAVQADPSASWGARDRRFEATLRRVKPEQIDRLALYLPDDGIEVSFRDVRDPKGQWRKLSQGSPGQQTAALLAFVLGYGNEPIILDQPEDDLDNVLIYELVVRRLREIKPTRQVVVVTHNPNIVVHGDAELVVSLDAIAGQTKVVFAGSLQDEAARDEVCRVMEGGRDAFESRYRRIMHPGGR